MSQADTSAEVESDSDVDANDTRSTSISPEEQVERLKIENERLRREYRSSRRADYRRSALVLTLLGVAGLASAVFIPSVRQVLIIVGSIGLFAGVLTRYLTPERFLPLDVAEGIYDSVHEHRRRLLGELEVLGNQVYVPHGGTVRLYVPQYDESSLPETEMMQGTFVAAENDSQRGVAFAPTGSAIFEEFERALDADLGTTPTDLVPQLSEGVSSGLELVQKANGEVDTAGKRVSFRMESVPFGSPDRIDHPVVSFLGVGLAKGLDCAVTVSDTRATDDATIVSFSLDTELSS